MTITKETNIAELLEQQPKAASVFMEYGLHCAGCMAAAFDTIEQGATAHGLDDESIKNMLEDLNLVINENADLGEEESEEENSQSTSQN